MFQWPIPLGKFKGWSIKITFDQNSNAIKGPKTPTESIFYSLLVILLKILHFLDFYLSIFNRVQLYLLLVIIDQQTMQWETKLFQGDLNQITHYWTLKHKSLGGMMSTEHTRRCAVYEAFCPYFYVQFLYSTVQFISIP